MACSKVVDCEGEKFDIKRKDISVMNTHSKFGNSALWSIHARGELMEHCFYLQLTPRRRASRDMYSFPFRLPRVKIVPLLS